MNNQEIKICPHSEAQRNFLLSQSKYLAAIAGLGGGKTHIGAAKALLKCIANPGIRGCVTAPSYKMLRDATIPKYQEIFNELPDYAKFIGGDSPEARLKDNGQILYRSTEKPDYLRGPEYGFIHMDEAAQSPHYAFQILQGRLRQRNGHGDFFPLQMWITTTPSGLNWVYTEFAMQENREGFEIITWSTRDNTYLPPDYYKELMKQYSGKFAAQELEGKFDILQGDCMFDVVNLERRLKNECKPPKEILENGYVLMWKEPLVGVKYVGGVDCAGSGGEGMNCCVIGNAQTGEECLEIYGDMTLDNFVRYIDKYGRLYNNALIGVEVNHTVGGWVVKGLKDSNYPKLFRRGDKEDDLGWYTSAFNRSNVLAAYKVATETNQTTIYNAEAIREMRTFVSKPSGKWEHLDNCLDDRVMARALFWRMTTERQGAYGFKTFKRSLVLY